MSEVEEDLRRRVHSLRNAVSSIRLAVLSLQRGYKFDDEMAPMKIEVLEKAVKTLEKEQVIWEKSVVNDANSSREN